MGETTNRALPLKNCWRLHKPLATQVPQASQTLKANLLRKIRQASLSKKMNPSNALLRRHLSWVELAAGDTLMFQGEHGDAMYLSISGRLRAFVLGDDGVARDEASQTAVREMLDRLRASGRAEPCTIRLVDSNQDMVVAASQFRQENTLHFLLRFTRPITERADAPAVRRSGK